MAHGKRSPEYRQVSVLFMDVVGFSKLPTDEEAQIVDQLTTAVANTSEFRNATARKELIPLPTGDGVALAFLGDPTSPVKCALELARTIQEKHPGLKLRMGLNAGLARPHIDIRGNDNLVGKGINIAQRVMDFGDAGHILVSRSMAEILEDLSGWRDSLHYLGVHLAKHGVEVHLYNLLKDGLGNPQIPARLRDVGIPQQQERVHMAQAPPDGFVARPKELEDAKRKLLAQHASATVALSTALSGAGGYGKTTLAQALCADKDIQDAFPDGVLWVDVGQTPNILRELGRLYHELTGMSLSTADEREASQLVAEQLKGRGVLLVIDDVWQRAHLKAFLDAAPHNARLITTRVVEILDQDTELVRVDEMQPEQAVEVLLRGIPERPEDLQPLRDLAHQLGHWALLLELANGKLSTVLRRRKATLAIALDFVIREYQRHGIEAFDRDDAMQRNDAAAKSIALSLELLEADERTKYLDLGVFPEDTAVPLVVAAELWGLELLDVQETLLRFDDLSLLKYFVQDETFRLHDVFYGWLRRQIASRSEATHARLLDRWGDPYHLPHAYAWRWIGWHLKQAERGAVLQKLLLDVPWMEAKLDRVGLDSLIVEYDCAQPSESHRLVQRALTQSSHVIGRDRVEFVAQVYARLLAVEHPRLADLRAELRNRLGCIIPLWPALTQADSPLIRMIEGHAGSVMSLALSVDGRTLASGSEDGVIKVWELRTGREERNLKWRPGSVTLALSGDGRTLAAGSEDGKIKVWDQGTGRAVRTLEGHGGSVSSLALSLDGRTLVSGSKDGTIKVWDLGTGLAARTLEGHTDRVTSLAMSGDGRTLVSGSYDHTIKVWELAGREVRTLEGHGGSVTSLALSRDRRMLVSGSNDKTIKVWELGTDREVETLEGHTRQVMALALSGDGKTLVSGSVDGVIEAWELGTSPEVRTLQGHGSPVSSLALSGDARTLVSGSYDRTIKVWELGMGREVQTPEGHGGSVWSLAVSGDGRSLVSGSDDHTIKVWELETGREVRTLRAHSAGVRSLALSGDGRTLASGSADRTIKVWDLRTGRELRTLKEPDGAVMSLALSGDGRALVSGSFDGQFGEVKVWDLGADREGRTVATHSGGVRSVALSGNARTLASGSHDGMIRVWTGTEMGMRILGGRAPELNSLALSGNGRTLVSGSDDKTIKVWDVDSGACLETFHADSKISSVAWSPNPVLAAAGDDSGHVYLFKIRLPDR